MDVCIPYNDDKFFCTLPIITTTTVVWYGLKTKTIIKIVVILIREWQSFIVYLTIDYNDRVNGEIIHLKVIVVVWIEKSIGESVENEG